MVFDETEFTKYRRKWYSNKQVHAVKDEGPVTFQVIDYHNDERVLERIRVTNVEVTNRSFLLKQANKVKVHKTRMYVVEAQRQSDEAQECAIIADQATIVTARAHATKRTQQARHLHKNDEIKTSSLLRFAHHQQKRRAHTNQVIINQDEAPPQLTSIIH